MQAIVNSADLNNGHVGIFIIDTATNEVLVSINDSKQMIPASNQKLLTTGAALHVLGPSFEFRTKLLLDGNNLIVIGDGDPTVGDMELRGIVDWSTENRMLTTELQPWIDAVVDADIHEIDTLLIDDRIFDRNFVHPSWPADQINQWYCAQVAGLNYHLNVVHFFPSPRKGSPAYLGDIAPAMNWISFDNKTTSKTGGKNASSFWVARLPNSNKMTARGNVKSTHAKPVKVAFHDPSIVFGNTLATHLRKNGVKVNKIERINDSYEHTTGQLLFEHITPLQTALMRSNTYSHNLYAEVLLKRLSAAVTQRPGTFDEGARVVEAVVTQRLGRRQDGLSVADGSGMSRDNLISTHTLALWLASFDPNDSVGKRLVASLATPGNGTLAKRFGNIEHGDATIHAKSGYLRGVCALSGYIIFDGRKPIVFSILVNDVKGTVSGAKKMQEAIVSATIGNLLN